MANLLGCAYREWPTEYLGLPLGGSPGTWNLVLDRRGRNYLDARLTVYPLGVELHYLKSPYPICQAITLHFVRFLRALRLR